MQKKFIDEYTNLLDKPVKIIKLPDDYPNYAHMIENSDFYEIGVRTNINNPDFETNLCHELYHAYQISQGFPIVFGISPDTSKFCENLRSTILDLSDNMILKSRGFSYDAVVRTRLKQCKHLCATAFREIKDQFSKDLLVIDLILDLSDFTDIQKNNILDSVRTFLPDVYQKYTEYHNVIFDLYDFNTAEGCLDIFAYVFDDIGLWPAAVIKYKGFGFRRKEELRIFLDHLGTNVSS